MNKTVIDSRPGKDGKHIAFVRDMDEDELIEDEEKPPPGGGKRQLLPIELL